MGKNADAEIWRCMETIDFVFGKRTYTVKEAGLIFVYETGLDLARVYVIALSENCGTVIFYIPDDLFELMSDRAEELNCSLEKYISDLVEYQYAEKRIAAAAAQMGVNADELSIAVRGMAEAAAGLGHTAEAASAAFMELGKALNSANETDVRKVKANNWLKMHGYPMRRKGKGRKKK